MIYLFIRKTKWVGLLVALLLMRFTNRFIELNYYDLFFWQFPFVLGIGWSIYQETMKNISTYIKGKSVSLIVCVTILLVFGVLQRLYGIVPYGKLVGIRFDGFLTILILFFVIFILRNCLYVYDALVFLGKHSMNIYMTHTFLNGYWTPIHTFIQTNPVCRWCGLNMWMLLAVCLLISIFLEFCKDKCYWDRITCVIIKYFEKK